LNLPDQPITGKYHEDHVFDDSQDDLYAYEKMRDETTPCGQRTSELGVIDEGIRTGVKTLVIMSPTIYGVDSGEFNKSSIQGPGYVKSTIANVQAVVVAEGEGIWDNVHIEDLAELYKLCLLNVLEKGGSDLPTGRKGIIFSENGQHTRKGLAQGVANAAYEVGKIKTKDVKSVSLEEAVNIFTFTGGDTLLMELGFSSNSRTKSAVGRSLGWKPTRDSEAWTRGFAEEVMAASQ
jgi:nucleoside-diphosphate-sugar epimerase